MVKKRKTAKGTAQKIGNPPKHPQFGKGTAGPRPAKGPQKPQHLPRKGRSRPSLRDGRWEEPNDFGARSDDDELCLARARQSVRPR